MSSLLAKRPHVSGNGVKVLLRKLRAAHGRHRASIVLRSRDPVSDDLLDGGKTAIAPEPMTAGEIRPKWRSLRIRSVTAGACPAALLTAKNPRAQLKLVPRGARGNWQPRYCHFARRLAGLWIKASRRLRIRSGRSGCTGGRSRFDASRCGVAVKGHAPDAASDVI